MKIPKRYEHCTLRGMTAAASFSTYGGLPTEHAHAKIKRYAPR